MKNNKIITFAVTLSFLLSGCGGGGGSSTSTTTSTVVQIVRGPVLHATVKDNANQSGVEQGNGYYKFSNAIKYPITATGGFIDVDRDGKVNAGDVPNTMVLKTTKGTVVTVATTYDANTTTNALVTQALSDLNISRDDLYKKTPLDSIAIEAISNVLYKHELDNNLSNTLINNGTLENEIKTEHESYKNSSSHDSKKVEQELITELITSHKIQELTQEEADSENQKISDAESSQNNEGSSNENSSNSTESNENTSSENNSNSTESNENTSSENNSNSTESNENTSSENSSNSTESDENESSENTTSSSSTTTPSQASGTYTLLAWNDLGMHCMDGSDFSVFSILPPYNNLNAQLIKKDGTSGKHVVSGVTLSYTATKSLNGKINTTSTIDSSNNPKTNFWDYVGKLFNTTLVTDIGLTGNKTPSLVEQNLKYNLTQNWWEATGLPLTPYNDDGTKNYYPLVKVTAKDTSGKVLASTEVVLPISDEMDCKVCHSSTSGYTSAKPTAGWENDSNAEKDFKYNILKLHDEKFPTAVSDNQTALKAAGYNTYNDTGLYVSAKNGNPTLCATCHASNALPGTGITGIKSLTESLHSLHANVLDPIENITLGSSSNRSACYRCHPGATTQCLRGAMGKAKNADGTNKMQCQSCHGDMNAVGQHSRAGWFDEPNCQSCHQDGKRYTSAVTNTATGTLRAALDTRFATNKNAPLAGKDLYRFSTGHGKMQCSSCHGSTHAIYPSSHAEDNLQSIAVQGHEGTIAECTSCHTTIPNTTTGGPHGMHSTGQGWVSTHQDVVENNSAQCTSCHGIDYKGSVLSKTFSAKTLNAEHTTKSYQKGDIVSCYDCHNKKW